jgi:hypothetical protein
MLGFAHGSKHLRRGARATSSVSQLNDMDHLDTPERSVSRAAECVCTGGRKHSRNASDIQHRVSR